jgi:hypothetical protein
VEAKVEPASNIPKAPPVQHFLCWIRGEPFGDAALDTLALPTNGADDLDMSSHASFEEEDEIEFKPPALGAGGVEMTLAE